MTDIKRNLEVAKEPQFNCTKCGLCCKMIAHLDGIGAGEYRIKDRGDGICAHFATDTGTCRIYEHRPDACRIRDGCPPNVPLKDWYKFNELCCKYLQKKNDVRPDGTPDIFYWDKIDGR